MKILITGIAGLVGSNLSRYLLSKGENVVGIDNFFGGYKDFLSSDVGFYYADISKDIDLLSYIFEKEKFDYVYHLAAYAAEGLSPFIRNFNYTNNVLGSINIINQCIQHKIKKIIFLSSMAVYGNNPPPFTEDQIPNPVDPYGIAKYTIELDLHQAKHQFDLNYTIVRPHNIIGIYQNIWDKYRNVLGIWIRNVLENKPIYIFGDGKQTRSFSDVNYCSQVLYLLLNSQFNNETYNIGADKFISIIDTAKLLQQIVCHFGYTSSIVHVEERHEVKHAYCSHEKLKNHLGVEDNLDLQKIITEMFLWAKEQPARVVKQMSYEIDLGMYNTWK